MQKHDFHLSLGHDLNTRFLFFCFLFYNLYILFINDIYNVKNKRGNIQSITLDKGSTCVMLCHVALVFVFNINVRHLLWFRVSIMLHDALF